MVAAEPVAPVGWAIQCRPDGKPLHLVVCVVGPENIAEVVEKLKIMRPGMVPVSRDFDIE